MRADIDTSTIFHCSLALSPLQEWCTVTLHVQRVILSTESLPFPPRSGGVAPIASWNERARFGNGSHILLSFPTLQLDGTVA